MRSFQFSKYCLVALMCLGLFACSTASQNKPAGGGGGNSYNEEGLQSNGIGDEADFSNGRGNALKPGCNQIYYFDYDDNRYLWISVKEIKIFHIVTSDTIISRYVVLFRHSNITRIEKELLYLIP